MWHGIDTKEVFSELKTSEAGISFQEASYRLEKYGKNEIRQIVRVNPFLIFLEQFKSVFIAILLAAAVFSFFIRHYVDVLVIAAIVAINASVGFFQQYKAEKTIAELREMLVPKVKVVRSGKVYEILSSNIVPGDIILVSEGDKIMADCRVLLSNGLQTNEAVLTGESFPQSKHAGKVREDADVVERTNMLYMGTMAVKGNARAVVVATGMESEFGKIAGMVQQIKTKKTPLEEKLDSFSRRLAAIILVLAAITVGIGLYRGEEIGQMILIGIALAISVIPEGIPAVIALTLAFAIQRMKKHNSLIRKLPAAETLGRTTVICTDKTGTLTEEEMGVVEVYCDGKSYKIDGKFFMSDGRRIFPQRSRELMQLLKTGVMCNNARLEKTHGKINIFGDPTEKALIVSAEKAGLVKKEETEKENRVKEFPFSSKRKMMSIVRKNHNCFVSYVKGAPDMLLKHCVKEFSRGNVKELTEKRRAELISEYEGMASEALRVLAFAYKPIKGEFDQKDAESGLIFAGFQGMVDPPRREIKQAIAECKTAGIKVKMLTGDSVLTARAIAGMINLDGGENSSIEGHELERLSEEDFDDVVRDRVVFARITPELKLRIVQSLRKQGEIVAVTGDGVNDILALKEAHIGVAMGIRGTDVAREVSDIILLDDNFSSIVDAVREGRRVYDNMKKSIKFHLAANIGELFLVVFALLMALPLPLMPLAILWMNLITDSLPSLALSVEKEEENIMKKKPINSSATILGGIWKFMLIAGVISFIATITIFVLFYQQDLEKARTLALTTAVFGEMFLVFTCRSDVNVWKIGIFSNKFLVYSVLAAVVLQLMAIYTPLSIVFGFKALSIGELALSAGLASIGLVFFEVTKMFNVRAATGINKIHDDEE